jgi:hypothetical protein
MAAPARVQQCFDCHEEVPAGAPRISTDAPLCEECAAKHRKCDDCGLAVIWSMECDVCHYYGCGDCADEKMYSCVDGNGCDKTICCLDCLPDLPAGRIGAQCDSCGRYPCGKCAELVERHACVACGEQTCTFAADEVQAQDNNEPCGAYCTMCARPLHRDCTTEALDHAVDVPFNGRVVHLKAGIICPACLEGDLATQVFAQLNYQHD